MKIKRSDFLKLMSVTAASAVLAGCGSSVVEQAAQSTANSRLAVGRPRRLSWISARTSP